jgi:SAM-dependent methyltransferase
MATASILCPLCGNANMEIHISAQDQCLTHSTLGSSRIDTSHSRVLRCQLCFFGFFARRPSEEELAQLYSGMDSKMYESEERGRSNTAIRHLKIVHRYLTPGRLLEIGCASGAFLRSAVEAGWVVVGIEPSEELSAKAREALMGRGEVLCTTLQNASLPPSSFDAVVLWDVLEHVCDPMGFMRACTSLLRPGGYLFANVPDLDSMQARILGTRWPLFLPEHLNYFNRRSLRLCGTRANLTWMQFGRRPASFSISYVFYRLAQHRVPGASIGYRLVSRLGIGGIIIPVPLGELYSVWRR